MGTWLVPRAELSPDQLRAVELSPDEHRVFYGPPGSGKTLVLLHRARHLMDRFQVPPERCRTFVFTNVLGEYLRSAQSILRIPAECVVGYDHWCRIVYEKHIGRRVPWDKDGRKPDFVAIEKAIWNWLKTNNRSFRMYDFALVDEGQDLHDVAFEILAMVAKHVTVCADPKQQIYEGRATENAILRGLGVRSRSVSFLEAYRCCPYIAQLAARFLPEADERRNFLRQAKTEQVERERPLMFIAVDEDEEKRRLLEVLKRRLERNERVAILLGLKRQVYGFARFLNEAGLEVEVPPQHKRESAFPVIDFSTDRPKILTYHAAKGLTFDSVLLPRLASHSFPRGEADRLHNLLFVGVTRATRWVYLSTIRGRELPLLRELALVNGTSDLDVKASQSQPTRAPAPDGTAGVDEETPSTSDPFSDLL